MSRIFTLGAVLAFLQLAPTTATAQYYATAPWCAVISLGAGDVHWECIYGSIEQCRTTILAGNRGFCNPNPAYVGAQSRGGRVVRVRISRVRSCSEIH